MSKLVNGNIPANTVCPYRTGCGDFAKNYCIHAGTGHPVPFSCAMARSFEVTSNRKK